jgi:hypothetical protein
MLDIITDFISNNTTMVIVAVIALVAMVGIFMFKPQAFKPTDPQQFQGNDMEMRMNNPMCDMDSGICQPHQEMEQQMTPETQQQMMQEQQMIQEQQMNPEMQQEMRQEQEMTTEM